MTTTINPEMDARACTAAGNWHKFTCFCWFEKPGDPDSWTVVYTHNRDSGPLDRANAKVIAKALEPFDDDARAESHSHWAVGHVSGYAIRVYRDGVITEAFAKWCELQDKLDDYPVLDDSVYSDEEQEEIDASWKAWVSWDFPKALERKFKREFLDDDDVDEKLEELFNSLEPEWWEESSGMTCNIERVVEKVEREQVKALFAPRSRK